ncbi:hypothetical protein FPQ18DRAFT_263080 [Pyronema domesticum]|nr:hypothetical protein FPQ18DRAFT_263080 [Pyronema domesticum]
MAANNQETQPLLPTTTTPSPVPSTPPRQASGTGGLHDSTAPGPRLALRNRALGARGTPPPVQQAKIGPQRTSKVSQKLKILPSPEDQDEESGRDVYSQVTRIKDTTARRDAERLGKAERTRLPRVTAYATANSYNLDGLMKFLKGRTATRGTKPRKFDECIFSPFSYTHKQATEDLLGDLHGEEAQHIQDAEDQDLDQDNGDGDDTRSLMNFVDQQHRAINNGDVFLFQYGVVVIWGMSLEDEAKFLRDIAKFENEKLADDDVQVENFNFYVTSSYQPRIYNDFITLRDNRNYMIKLSISHAIAQSVKISLFEDLMNTAIDETKMIPDDIAQTGKVGISRKEVMKHIGELFILRININLQGSVLDSPELMWSEPQLEPVYQAARSYLEINQRLELLNQRLEVIKDLLQMLKEQMTHTQGEHLEWIVIILIAAEIVVAVVNVCVDLMASS